MGNKQNYTKKHNNFKEQNQSIDGSVIAYELRKIMRSYFPNFKTMLRSLADHRKRKDYRTDELLCAAFAMFIFKSGSRNAINNDRRHSGEFTSNFQKLFDAPLPHLDAVQDFFEVLSPAEL